MAKSKNDLNIHFKGKSDDLVIKLNGKIIYPYQEEKLIKEINPNKLKTQLKTGVAAVFSGAINRIIPLRQTWKRWPVKSRVPYRNMLSANIKRCLAEHPTTANIICPDSHLYLPILPPLIGAEGIKIEVSPLSKVIDFYEDENMITAAGILSTYCPREKDYEPCEIYPLSKQIKDFVPSENFSVTFLFNSEMLENISKYEKCILYFTVVIGKDGGYTKRWFTTYTSGYLLRIDAEGKLEKGVQIVGEN